jgi:hypothetical protein
VVREWFPRVFLTGEHVPSPEIELALRKLVSVYENYLTERYFL